ncbi:SCO family protein [candidate division KSB1 bacterium]|nr:SCO family protein [candidate division KSB1 bacterium]
MRLFLPLALCTMLSALSQAHAQLGASVQPEILREVGIDQRLNEQLPLDLVFRDEAGQSVALQKYFGEKPVVLALVYYECPMLCTQVLNGLTESLRPLAFNVGEQFEVVTVSFDPRETPALAAAKKKGYVEKYNRAGASEGWHFLTGDSVAIRQLTEAVGFRYKLDPFTKQYAHASGIIVATPQGKLARYFYGIEYPTRDLRFALIEASENRIGNVVDQVLMYCFHYDPSTGKYSVAVINVLRVTGIATVLALGTFMLVMLRRERRQ